MPQVAVLIAAYNAEATLPKCLDSLCHQTLKDIEILCVDDCSTDDTYNLLKIRASQDGRIRVFRTPENSGQAVARNLALEHVTAPFTCMVDADDWLSLNALESAFEVIRQYPMTDCVIFHLMQTFEDGRGEEYILPSQLLFGESVTGQEAFLQSIDQWKLHGLYLTRTALYKRFPFDTTTRLYSDDNTTHYHYYYSREVRACDGIYYYRKHAASMTMSFNLRRFDFMEANLSMRRWMQEQGVAADIIRRYEVSRWMTFIACYRLYLIHRDELTDEQKTALKQRFKAILHSFSASELPRSARWKPGYQLTGKLNIFDLQQRLYMRVRTPEIQ